MARSGQRSLPERLAEVRERLAPAELRVAEYLIEYGAEAASLRALEIARRLGTSDATVVRTAKSLGYSGLPELRRELEAARVAMPPPSVTGRLGARIDRVTEQPVAALDYVLRLQIELLQEARRTVRPDAFGRALEILDAAARIQVYGIGPSAFLADFFDLRLRRIGRQARAMTQTGMGLVDSLITLRGDDAVVLIFYAHNTADAGAVLERCAEVGAPVIALTDISELADRVDVALTARRSRLGMLSSVGTALVLIEALLLGLSAYDRSRTLAGLDVLDTLRARLSGET